MISKSLISKLIFKWVFEVVLFIVVVVVILGFGLVKRNKEENLTAFSDTQLVYTRSTLKVSNQKQTNILYSKLKKDGLYSLF